MINKSHFNSSNDNTIDKSTVAANFARAASTYDAHAEMQKFAAAELSRFTASTLTAPPNSIVDVGCGTGLLTHQWLQRFPATQITATDIANEMLEQCRHNLAEQGGSRIEFKIADAEKLTLASSVDLIASGLTVQWLDLDGCLKQWWPQTNAIAFSTLVDDSLATWKQAVQRHAGESPKVIPALSSRTVQRVCQTLSPHRFEFEIVRFEQSFESVHQFLRSLKMIGAHTSGDNQIDPTVLRRAMREFSSTFIAEYQIAICVLTKEPHE